MEQLQHCERASIDELAAALSEKTGRRVEQHHIVALAEKLGRQGLLAGAEHHAPAKSNPLLALRWKALVTDPHITTRNVASDFPSASRTLFRNWVNAERSQALLSLPPPPST